MRLALVAGSLACGLALPSTTATGPMQASGSPVAGFTDQVASENQELREAIANMKTNLERLLNHTSAGTWADTDAKVLHTRADTLLAIVNGTKTCRSIAITELSETISTVSSLSVDNTSNQVQELEAKLAAQKWMERMVFRAIEAGDMIDYFKKLLGADFLAAEGDYASASSIDAQDSRSASHMLHALDMEASLHVESMEHVKSKVAQLQSELKQKCTGARPTCVSPFLLHRFLPPKLATHLPCMFKLEGAFKHA